MAHHLTGKFILGLAVILSGALLILGKGALRRDNSIIYSVPIHQKIVALTFDDGPHPVYTGQILDILSKYNVRATFFMIGTSINEYPAIVKQVAAKGHSIGNHTFTHPINLANCSPDQIISELRNCESVIEKYLDQPVHIFRPPRGLYNNRVAQIAKAKGYQTVLWSVCGNGRNLKNPKLMAKRVIRNIHPGDIILLHDGTYDSRWMDVEATQLIIEALLKKGYQFVTVPELLKLRIKLINNPFP